MKVWVRIFNRYIDFYESYHSEKINQIIHLFGVPTVYWTVLMILSHPNFSFALTDSESSSIWWQACTQINITLFVVITYIICYSLFSPQLVCIYVAIFLFLGWSANLSHLLFDNILWVAIPLHIIGWAAQFIGHGYFEKRKPALLDNIVQAFLVAPWFALHETFGLRKWTPSANPQSKDL